MSFKIKQNGIVKDLKLPASSIQLLDMDDNYTTNNLEEVLQELGESDSIYISDNEPDKDGVWISNENIAQTGENKTFNALKDYIEENVTPQIKRNTDNISQLSNPNLLINGDFQVWSKGTSFIGDTNLQYTADRWKAHYFGDGGTFNSTINKSDMGLSFINNRDSNCNLWISQILNEVDCNKLKGKTVTVQAKISNNTTGSISLYIGNGDWLTHSSQPLLDTSGVITLTITLPQEIIDIRVSLYSSATKNTGFTVEWVKLEVGTVATPFMPKPYVQELQDCLMYDNDNLTIPYNNPNLLINGDFSIWQRGELFTTDNAGFAMYISDRWHEWSYNDAYMGRCRVEKYNGHLKWTTVGNNGLRQCIENNLNDIPLTLSVKIKGNIGDRILLEMTDSSSPMSDITSVAFKDFTLTGKEETLILNIPKFNYSKFPTVHIHSQNVSVIEVFYVKLEQGTVATPFTPRPVAEELMLCKRYYETVFYSTRLQQTCPTSYEAPSYYQVEKRIVPSITVTSVRVESQEIDKGLVCMNQGEDGKNRVLVWFLPNEQYFIVTKRIDYSLIADAEIY